MMKIGKLAESAGVNVETVRFYQRVGLLEQPPKPQRGFRSYSSEALEKLLFIRRAKNFGFSLADIGELLKLGNGTSSCQSACALAEKNLQAVRVKKKELEELEAQISELLSRCRSQTGCMVLETLSGVPKG
jgi:MerR family transcriptional regulator, mercuric resistance operon regulatory protein